jgi:hypothetical protein
MPATPYRTLFESTISLVAWRNGSHTVSPAWRWWKGWEWSVLVEAARCQWPKPHRNLEFVSRLSCLVQRRGRDLSVGLVSVAHESNSDTAVHTVRLERPLSEAKIFRFRPDKLWGPAMGTEGNFLVQKLPKRETWVLVAAKHTQDNI